MGMSREAQTHRYLRLVSDESESGIGPVKLLSDSHLRGEREPRIRAT